MLVSFLAGETGEGDGRQLFAQQALALLAQHGEVVEAGAGRWGWRCRVEA
jgi:hypothetical protein